MDKPFATTLDVGSSLANKTGSWRTERPVYIDWMPLWHLGRRVCADLAGTGRPASSLPALTGCVQVFVAAFMRLPLNQLARRRMTNGHYYSPRKQT